MDKDQCAHFHGGYLNNLHRWKQINIRFLAWSSVLTLLSVSSVSFLCRMSAMGRCLCCVKYLMFVFNLIFWVSMCTYSYIIWVTTDEGDFSVVLFYFTCVSLIFLSFSTDPYVWFLHFSEQCIVINAAFCLIQRFISWKARRMRLVWRWSLAVLQTDRVFLSPSVLSVPLSCQSAASRWWYYHGDWLPGLSWSP